MKGRKHGLPGMLLLFLFTTPVSVCPSREMWRDNTLFVTILSKFPSCSGTLPAASDRRHLYCSIIFLFTHLHACVCTPAHAEIRLAGSQFSPSAHIGPEAGTQVVRFGDSAVTHWVISPALCTVLRHRYRESLNLLWSVLRAHSDRRVWGSRLQSYVYLTLN